jgi:predicted nucleic acid-binding protein
MPRKVLVDAGPIVAFLRAADQFHGWAVEQFQRFPRFLTCEAVLAESCARLAYYGDDQSAVVDLLRCGSLEVQFSAPEHGDRLSKLMKKYRNRPMDLADACLVVMSEQSADVLIVTLDAGDFSVYRRHDREIVPHISPRR